MNPLIIADESVDFLIVTVLRDAGFAVTAILEEYSGWPDEKVLEFAFEQKAFLITEDKDFGELSFRLQKPSHGILLIRMISETSETKASQVLALFQEDFGRFQGKFSVLEKSKLRVRPLQF